MLPDGVYSITNIQQEAKVGNQLMNSGATLDYLLTLIDPRTSEDSPMGLGDKIKNNKDLFSNYKDVLFAIGVRNYFAHPGGRDREYTEDEKRRASEHLLRAIREACGHPKIPLQVSHEILNGSYQNQQKAPKPQHEPEQKARSTDSQTAYSPSSFPGSGRRWAGAPPRRRGVRKFVILLILLGIAYALFTKLGPTFKRLGGIRTAGVPAETAYVNSPQLNLRAGPGSEYAVITRLARGDAVSCLEKRQSSDGGTWVRVRAASFEGWANQKLLSKDKPPQQVASGIPPTSSSSSFVEDFDGKSLGDAYGVSFVSTPSGLGAVFTQSAGSRVEYPPSRHFPSEGTLEWAILVSGGYDYTYGQLTASKPEACIFTTTGPDTWYPGSTWVSVKRDGTVTFAMADTKGGETPLRILTAEQTTFRFGEWHTVGVSYGSNGRFIRVDGYDVAHDGLSLPLAVGGDLSRQTDMPTIGQMLSRFPWPRNQFDTGFDGIVDTFRASSKQSDWNLSR